VSEFVEPENCLSNSPHFKNPVECLIWGALQQLIYRHGHIRDIEQLKEVLQTCWQQIGHDVINHDIGQIHKRLSLVVVTSGGHTEHRFD